MAPVLLGTDPLGPQGLGIPGGGPMGSQGWGAQGGPLGTHGNLPEDPKNALGDPWDPPAGDPGGPLGTHGLLGAHGTPLGDPGGAPGGPPVMKGRGVPRGPRGVLHTPGYSGVPAVPQGSPRALGCPGGPPSLLSRTPNMNIIDCVLQSLFSHSKLFSSMR